MTTSVGCGDGCEEGKTVTEYAEITDVSQSLMTRHLADLGKINRYHEAGYDLIEAKTDPMDRRTKRNQLTAKGQRLVGQILVVCLLNLLFGDSLTADGNSISF